MSSASLAPSHTLVNHKYGTDGHLPSEGEIIVVRLAQDLFGPGSILSNSRTLPSRVTQHNYHHAVVLGVNVSVFPVSVIHFTVFPMPAYSFTDPVSGLSSTNWLLAQPDDVQQLHIPVPYEESATSLHPPFSTPARFGDLLEIGGWKNSRPSWVQAVPQVTDLKYTTAFKCFEPPIKLSSDEVMHLKEYARLLALPVLSSNSTMSPFPGGGDAASGGPDVSFPGNDTVMSSNLLLHQKGRAGLPTGGSIALQTLYANDAVKYAFIDFPSMTLDSGSDDDDDDDDDNWEDNMDPITFNRYYAASHPAIAKVVQDHDQKVRERLNQGIAGWLEGVQSEM